jgi:hypothetical protein
VGEQRSSRLPPRFGDLLGDGNPRPPRSPFEVRNMSSMPLRSIWVTSSLGPVSTTFTTFNSPVAWLRVPALPVPPRPLQRW